MFLKLRYSRDVANIETIKKSNYMYCMSLIH